METYQTNMCFACGKENPCGLKLSFSFVENGRAISKFSLGEFYQGWKNMAHGGIIATILDEAMAWAVMKDGIHAVTAKLEVNYRKPVPIKRKLKVIGEIVERRGKILKTQAFLQSEEGETLASAKAIYIEVST